MGRLSEMLLVALYSDSSVWMAVYLTGYSDCLTGFREPLSPPYTVIDVKLVWKMSGAIIGKISELDTGRKRQGCWTYSRSVQKLQLMVVQSPPTVLTIPAWGEYCIVMATHASNTSTAMNLGKCLHWRKLCLCLEIQIKRYHMWNVTAGPALSNNPQITATVQGLPWPRFHTLWLTTLPGLPQSHYHTLWFTTHPGLPWFHYHTVAYHTTMVTGLPPPHCYHSPITTLHGLPQSYYHTLWFTDPYGYHSPITTLPGLPQSYYHTVVYHGPITTLYGLPYCKCYHSPITTLYGLPQSARVTMATQPHSMGYHSPVTTLPGLPQSHYHTPTVPLPYSMVYHILWVTTAPLLHSMVYHILWVTRIPLPHYGLPHSMGYHHTPWVTWCSASYLRKVNLISWTRWIKWATTIF